MYSLTLRGAQKIRGDEKIYFQALKCPKGTNTKAKNLGIREKCIVNLLIRTSGILKRTNVPLQIFSFHIFT